MSDPSLLSILTGNLARIQERISAAAHRAGRDPADITLVAVTKYVDTQLTRLLFEAGCRHLGESRPQALWKKAEELSDLPIEWHLVGHLQRNKIRQTIPFVSFIHSVDRRSLLQALVAESRRITAAPVSVLLEVNVSGDASKHGFVADEVDQVLRDFGDIPEISIRGLMAMAGLEHQGSEAQADFRKLRVLAEGLRADHPFGHRLEILSMGMSGDLEEAIAEGATMVRVGSALFEGLPAI